MAENSSADNLNNQETEMDLLSTNIKYPRFQVNKVESDDDLDLDVQLRIRVDADGQTDDENNIHSVTDRTRLNSDVKSFRHLTREVLPRLDNYRNIMSLQAANRPTLDELRNSTLPTKAKLPVSQSSDAKSGGQLKFGWIQGVLIRCLLNIWGVMLFLRLSWVVAQAGIGQSILLILTTTAVTSITALSMSAISTNGVIKGDVFYMAYRSVEGGVAEESVYLYLIYIFIIVLGNPFSNSVNELINEFQAQIGLLVILLVAILDFFIGSFIGPRSDEAKSKGFLGYNATLARINFFPDYRFSEGVEHGFFSVFAIFFPAATGILAGANISGDLKDPQLSIPKGTLLSILITTLSYILMAIVLGSTVSRDATGDVRDYINASWPYCPPNVCHFGLHNNFQVVELVSWIGPIIYAGCFAAALSSALASLVSAPKVFQALCKDKLYPKIEWFAKGYGNNNEPLRGYVLTFVIATVFILIGELNLIAPLISNFFLAAYTLINFSTFHASLAKPVGWRPTFKYYNMWLSLLGSILCVLVMFLISWLTALLTLAVELALYLIVSYRKPDVNWGSTTQAQIYKNALQAAHQLNAIEEHVKNYRPQILVLSGMPSARPALVDFAHLLTKNLSMLVCGHINTSHLPQRERNVLNYKANSWLKAHKLKAFYAQVDGLSFAEGCKSLLKACGIGKLKPNILLMGYKADWQTCTRDNLNQYFEVLHTAFDLHMAAGIIRIQKGFDCSVVIEEETSNFKNSPKYMTRNRSYSQMSQGSSNSGRCEIDRDAVSELPNPEESLKKSKSLAESLATGCDDLETKEIMPSEVFYFQKKPRRSGTIDVWWLYDDGGLTLLLPYIISTRSNWNKCKLRVFALANKRDELELEHRNMASLLAKFRIEYTNLKVVPDITTKPMDSTQAFFDLLIADFRSYSETSTEKGQISDAELLAVKDKTNRHLRLRELLLEHSNEANLVVLTLPIPRKNIVSAPLYLAWLELLSKDMPPILLIRGNQTSVLTFYS
nr:bumetanide-sensitive sodium-(potassium)-chloride cotransporter [Leptinotarsa decemlineata]